MKHRDPEHLDKEETMKQGEGSNWPWLVLICFRETEETTEEFGNWLAKQLSLFANKHDSGYLGNKNLFIYQSSGCDPKPVVNYILTKDSINHSKTIYGVMGVSKEDSMKDAEVLESFFGSVAKAKQILDPLTETQWQHFTL